MKRLTLLLSLFTVATSFAQIRLEGYNQALINPELYSAKWKAYWVSVPDEPVNDYGVYHFRKTFDLPSRPEQFIVHISADNRYKLYVNGQLASMGPTRGDIYNWNFETVDLAPYLQAGVNILAAEVWNFAEKKPVAQISFNQTGFLLQGNTEKEEIANTDTGWMCIRNEAYTPWEKPVYGYYVAGAGEMLDASVYPWGWEKPGYDDSGWKAAQPGMNGAMKGFRDYPGRLLVPSPIPQMELRQERIAAIRQAEGIACPPGFLTGIQPLFIPANTKAKLLLDHGHLTTGYLSLLFDGGKGADLSVGYTEALYEGEGASKGHRDEIEGKRFIGYQDRILPDGGSGRSYTTLWWRTWRYLEVIIETKEEPLTLNDIYGTFSGYPFVLESEFEAKGKPEYNKILDIGWLTARLCANETYMDCPYYEQLQYFGDTRIQAMISMYNTSDPYMVKNAIEQGRQSMVADGITMSRYPSYIHQFISSFSLWWICMGYDYWMMRGDEAYLQTLLPAYRQILSWYEGMLKPDGSLDYIPHWFFLDWAESLDYGEPIREKNGNSAIQDLIFLLTLESASEMEDTMGEAAIAIHYRELADRIRADFEAKYWNNTRGMYADTHDHRSFSQHANILAILAGIKNPSETKLLMEKILADTENIIPVTIYFRYYLNMAMHKAGLGDQYLDNLQVWEEQMALGLTTWAEQPEPSRSDCHAWSASPNIEFYRIVLGIEPMAPGFSKIRIAPSLGDLKEAAGSIPHPKGKISVSYKLDKKGKGKAVITIPQESTGIFVWKGQEYNLRTGEQEIALF